MPSPKDADVWGVAAVVADEKPPPNLYSTAGVAPLLAGVELAPALSSSPPTGVSMVMALALVHTSQVRHLGDG